MPYISTEALVGAAVLIFFIISYRYIPHPALSSSGKPTKKRKAKKAKSTLEDKPEPAPLPHPRQPTTHTTSSSDTQPKPSKIDVLTNQSKPKSFADAAAGPSRSSLPHPNGSANPASTSSASRRIKVDE